MLVAPSVVPAALPRLQISGYRSQALANLELRT